MKKLMSKRAVAFTAGALGVLGMGAGVAYAGVVSQQVLYPAPPSTANSGPANLRVVHTTAEDFESPWHTHPGPAIVQVQDGYFKIYQGSCAPTVVGPGETFIEVPGVPVKAVAKGHIEWTTTLVIPGALDDDHSAPPAQSNLPSGPC